MFERIGNWIEAAQNWQRGQRRRFMRDEEGSFIIFGLALFMMMVYAGGLGVDVMRYEAHRAKVQQTLDRAILAAASLNQSLDAKEVVLDYFAKAGLGHIITEDDITVEIDQFSRRVEASLNLKMNTTFLRLGNFYTLDFPAAGGAEESTSITEISLVVDVSGSMGNSSSSGYSKIYELRRAAKKFVNIMLCNPADPDSTDNCTVEPGIVSISMIPYSEQVVLGEDLAAQFNLTSEHNRNTCVTFYNDDFNTAALPTNQLIQRTGWFDPSGSSSSAPRLSRMPCQTDSWREIVAFEDDYDDLHDEIDALGASGNTSIDLGMKWATALLNEAAQPAITGLIADELVSESFAGRPFSNTTRGLSKVIVLMTDGANTSQDYLFPGFHSGPSPVWKADGSNNYSIYDEDNDRYYWAEFDVWKDHPYGSQSGWFEVCVRRYSYFYGWYDDCSNVYEPGGGATQWDFVTLWDNKTINWWEQFSFLPQAASYNGTGTKDSRLSAICTAAKNQGITVFTMGFEVGYSQHAIMRSCASAPSYYFNVDGLDISSAFAAIAREISKLRLVY